MFLKICGWAAALVEQAAVGVTKSLLSTQLGSVTVTRTALL